MNNKILITYFSHKGENWKDGKLINLNKGNTEIVCETIQELTNGVLFEIEEKDKYPYSYNECVKQAKDEKRNNYRPEIVNDIGISSFDIIILAYPNWWSTMPMPVWTFLENKNFSNKTILPLCTHEGSGMGNSVSDIKKICTNAKVLDGLPIYGSNVLHCKDQIISWLKKGKLL